MASGILHLCCLSKPGKILKFLELGVPGIFLDGKCYEHSTSEWKLLFWVRKWKHQGVSPYCLSSFPFKNSHMNECTNRTMLPIQIFTFYLCIYFHSREVIFPPRCFSTIFFLYIFCQKGEVDGSLAPSISNKSASDWQLETPFRRTMGNYKGNHWGAMEYSAKGKLKWCHSSTKARTNASWSLKTSIWNLKGFKHLWVSLSMYNKGSPETVEEKVLSRKTGTCNSEGQIW